jgi:hypothetical protein
MLHLLLLLVLLLFFVADCRFRCCCCSCAISVAATGDDAFASDDVAAFIVVAIPDALDADDARGC